MSFRIDRVEFPGVTLDLAAEEKSFDDQNYCTIIIGKNGIGKSRFLYSLCKKFMDDDSVKSNKGRMKQNANASVPLFDDFLLGGDSEVRSIDFSLDPKIYTSGYIKPARLIVATSSPFDKFPIDENTRWSDVHHQEDGAFYHYLGTRNAAGFSHRNSHITRIVETIIKSSSISEDRRADISEIFKIIGLSPEITVRYKLRISYNRLISLMMNGENALFDYLNRASALPFRVKPDRSRQIYEDLQLVLDNYEYVAKNDIYLKIYIDNRRFKNNYASLYFAIQRLVSARIISISSYEVRKSGRADQPFDITQASSGQQALLLLFLGIGSTLEDNSLVLIDEPEISLHPEWQESFLPLLSKIFSGFKGCHFIIATHSPLIISQSSEFPCTIISLDEAQSFKSTEYSNKSSDFQLVDDHRHDDGYSSQW